MSDSISTILLLPHAGHRDRVLAPHAPSCRRVAPGAILSWGTLVGEPGDVRHHVAHAGSCPVDEHVHLPLARDGVEVCEGTGRLRHVLAGHLGVSVDEGGVVFHGAHGDGHRDMRATTWKMHHWSAAEIVQFYGDPDQAWAPDGPHKTIHVPALAAPPWPAKPRHPLYTIWALGQVAQAQGLGTLVLLDERGEVVGG